MSDRFYRYWLGKKNYSLEGAKHHQFGKKRTTEERERSRDAAKRAWAEGVYDFDLAKKRANPLRGPSHFNYKNGRGAIRTQLYHQFRYREWRRLVFESAGYKCEECGKSGDMEAHHKKPVRVILQEHGISTVDDALKCDDLFDVSNGQCLCIECHCKIDAMRRKPKKSPQ